MQIQVDLQFHELVKAVEVLPQAKLKILKNKIERATAAKSASTKASRLKNLLLFGPTASSDDLEIIKNNRKQINEWLKK